MLDDSDISLVACLANPKTWLGFGILVMVVAVMAAIVATNEKECEAKTCVTGQPKLMDHECVCVTSPK